jgi:M6 family metalloprotease-like protein
VEGTVSRACRNALLFACCLSAAAVAVANAQEPPRVSGIQLPRGYFERVRRQPDLFQLSDGWIARAALAEAHSAALQGTLRVAVVLALFADSPTPHIGAAEIQRVLFDGPSDYGTASEFYAEASGGRFALDGQTVPWVRTGLTMQQVVGTSYGLGADAMTGTYLTQALALADPSVDFGLFDNDGPDGIPNSGDDDGSVDAVVFEFLEIAASCGGPSIWPHRSNIAGWLGTPYVTGERQPNGAPIVVNDYIVQSAADCSGVQPQTATTISHEMGHVLGLPDLYDGSRGILPEQRRWVVGCWSLMAAGSWGCGTSDREAWVRPTHLGAWERTQLGWIDVVEESGDRLGQEYTLPPMLSSGRALRIPLEHGVPADTNEYLLIEYRTQSGFDLGLPASGILVYHVDPQVPGNWPCQDCAQQYRVVLLEADGNRSLQRTFLDGGNRGESGDAWGVLGPGYLTTNSNPSTRLTTGVPSGVRIDDISIRDGIAHVTVSSGSIATDKLTQPFLLSPAQPLTPEEHAYLDRVGNANGQYDVGDLRAYLRR